jgi:hypothetical protein
MKFQNLRGGRIVLKDVKVIINKTKDSLLKPVHKFDVLYLLKRVIII